MATALFAGARGVEPGLEAGDVPLKTRSIPPGEAVRRSLDALR